jgi:signal transduction histidine kinase
MAIQASSSRQHDWDDMQAEAPAPAKEGFGRYGAAILTAILGLTLRGLFSPVIGMHDAYHTAWAAVVFAAWYCGMGPAIVTTLMSAVGVWYWFLPPGHTFAVTDPKVSATGMGGFLVLSMFIIALGEANRRSKIKSEIEIRERIRTEKRLLARERELEALHSALADRVEERTTELNAAITGLRQLSSRLLQAQDDERRRLARELHDSVGQLLAALAMNVQAVQSTPLEPAAAAASAENIKLVDQISTEIRTMSHLLHPPLLDEVGLASALRWYIDGFAARSKISVNLEIARDFGRLSNDMEIAIFRIVQECLTNVHRHSKSDTGVVRLVRDADRVWVEIRDAGRGIPPEKKLALNSSQQGGVGFRGMRERIQQLGGQLDIQSDQLGTIVKATMPIAIITTPAGAPAGNQEVA